MESGMEAKFVTPTNFTAMWGKRAGRIYPFNKKRHNWIKGFN